VTTLPNPSPGSQVKGFGLDLEDFRPVWLELKDRLFAGRAKQCLCMLIFFRQRRAMSPEITTRSVRGDKRFSVSIKRASAAAVSTRP
jgi:hypothetical protein